VTHATFGRYVTSLADLGLEAWSLLFGTRYADKAGASERLGELLATMDLGEEHLVQITYFGAENDFVFPWKHPVPTNKGFREG
jgi:hypothetical protein